MRSRRVFDEFRKANAKRFRGFVAPEANIKAVKVACEKPYSEGVIEERKLFMELMTGEQSAAQRYFFFAERKAAKIDGLPENTEPRPIRKVGVIGAGTMGGGISMNFLSAGIPVTIVEMGHEALDRGTGLMRRNYEASAAKGKLTEEQVSKAMGAADADARFLSARGLRPHHRGGVRGYGREEGGLHPPRQDRQAGRDPRVQHLLPRPQRDRGRHFAPRGRRRHALLLSGQRDEAARGRARREDRARTCC